MAKYESRDGDQTTGNYQVVLPDGRKQNVDYYVDDYSGYIADVTYEGEAHYDDEHQPTYASYGNHQGQPSSYNNNKPTYGHGYNKKNAYQNNGYKSRY